MVVRIVEGGSRRPSHLWARMGYLGAMVVVVLIGLLTGQGMGGEVGLGDLAKSGADLFWWISNAQVVFVCLLAPLFLATAIAQERASQTMDILLTTPLTNLQIVLGSLVGRLFFVLGLLLSGLPLFAVLLIFGGVPMQSVFISFAVAALTAITVGGAAVTLSVFRTGGRKAVFTFIIVVAAYLIGAHEFDRLFLQDYFPKQTTWLTPIHPLLVLRSTMDTANYRPPMPETLGEMPAIVRFYMSRPFATFAILSGVTTMVMMIASAVVLRHLGQGGTLGLGWLKARLRISSAVVTRGGEGDASMSVSGGGGGGGWSARVVWHNPVAWREARTRGGGMAGLIARWSFTVIGLAAGMALLLFYHFAALPDGSRSFNQLELFRKGLKVLLIVEVAVIVLVAIYMSAGSVSREREDGTLDLMLTTPVTPKQYIWGKLHGLVSFLSLMIVTPVLTVAMASVYAHLAHWMQWPTAGATVGMPIQSSTSQRWTPLMLTEAPLLLLPMLVPFVALCVMVGMSWSLKARGALGAVIPAVAIIGVVSLVLGVCGLNAAKQIPIIGPTLNAFSPATSILMVVDPWQSIKGFGGSRILSRVWLGVGAVIAGGGYCVIVYAMLLSMVRGFDHTVRKLSGTG